MIYLGFVFDFLLSFFLPVNSYFVVGDLDKNRLLPVIFVGVLLDAMYHKFLFNLALLLILYSVVKSLKLGNRFWLIKNILIYVVYFNVTYFLFGYSSNYWFAFGIGCLLQTLYLVVMRKLLK